MPLHCRQWTDLSHSQVGAMVSPLIIGSFIDHGYAWNVSAPACPSPSPAERHRDAVLLLYAPWHLSIAGSNCLPNLFYLYDVNLAAHSCLAHTLI